MPQIDVVNVVIQQIGRGCDETGFPGAGRAVEEITAFPNTTQLVVILLGFKKCFQIGAYFGFQIGVDDERVESGGVIEGNRFPFAVAVIVNPQFFTSLLDVVGDGVYVLKIRFENSSLILFLDSQQETPGQNLVLMISDDLI